MQLRLEGNKASIQGLTAQAIGAEDRGASAAALQEAKVYADAVSRKYRPGFLRSVTDVSVTGTLNEINLFEGRIDKSLIEENSIFEIYSLFSLTNSSSTKTIKFKINNTPILWTNPPARDSRWYHRRVFNRGKSQQISTGVHDGTEMGTNSRNSTFTIDTSEGLLFQVSAQLSIATDVITLNACTFSIY